MKMLQLLWYSVPHKSYQRSAPGPLCFETASQLYNHKLSWLARNSQNNVEI